MFSAINTVGVVILFVNINYTFFIYLSRGHISLLSITQSRDRYYLLVYINVNLHIGYVVITLSIIYLTRDIKKKHCKKIGKLSTNSEK